jgi:carboxypeptidase Taq
MDERGSPGARPARDPLVELKRRLNEVRDLEAVVRLLGWDQRTMMPPAGAATRAEQVATLWRLAHERFAGREIGRLLDELEPLADSLDPESDDARLIHVTRRDHEKARRVPAELRGEMARAAAEGNAAWVGAKAASDFASFLPHLERNVELRLRYVDCFEVPGDPYDALLDDYEPEATTEEVARIFAEIAPELARAAAEQRENDDGVLAGPFPVDRQEALSREVVRLLGTRPHSWRIDPTEHPFASGAGVDDVRITTRYEPDSMESLFSTMHEYGHGLYTHQLPRELERLPTGGPCSLGIHESQSRLWENLVGRSLPFWRFFYPRLQQVFPERLGGVEPERFYRAVNAVQPSLIRIRADEVTYGLHVILRFELEGDIVNGRLALRDLPDAWNAKMHEYLGVEVPNDARGVLQDMHWGAGMIGYFPTYLLGTVMSVQIWQKALEDVGDLEERIEQGDFAPLREWLGEHVHRLGRKYPPQETLRRATGSTIDAKPYLAYLREKYGLGVAAH